MTTFEVRKEIELEATPAEVWDAIATEAGLTAWFMPMVIDPDGDQVVAWDPPTRLAVQTPTAEDGSTQAFEYVIEGRDGGATVLRFVHSGVKGDDWSDEFEAMASSGWDQYLHTLSQYLRLFAGRPATYIEADGPPPSADAEAWSRLHEAISPAGPLELGTEVHLAVGDLGTVDGTIDYLTPNFVGVRTDDALIRFHGRSPLGMVVAVSHHAYGDDPVDPPTATKAWTTWLAQAFA